MIIEYSIYRLFCKDTSYWQKIKYDLRVKVFDISGKLIKDFDASSISKNIFDVSKLKTGNYVVIIKTEKDTLNKKLIKE
ncbi:T9SS type A sorting domain-containing protein [Epilithonimonas hungarica]|uniref:T9SS type A sorting domain-containing protein n=1 Tax=Epilithonimonas hungarica TaxID=454006 RepID=UPI0021CD8246|nr:T9SS type A sorting domain-containing protein [Epilithonimonas hungarica]